MLLRVGQSQSSSQRIGKEFQLVQAQDLKLQTCHLRPQEQQIASLVHECEPHAKLRQNESRQQQQARRIHQSSDQQPIELWRDIQNEPHVA
ncbi:hypothetical protein D3C72_1671670 [compost metagenome]